MIMKKSTCITALLSSSVLIMALTGGVANAAADSPIDPCLNCHSKETPELVQQFEAKGHSKTGVKCYVCHHADESNKEGMEHEGFFIITAVDVQTCESCHPDEGKKLLGQFSKDSGKHP